MNHKKKKKPETDSFFLVCLFQLYWASSKCVCEANPASLHFIVQERIFSRMNNFHSGFAECNGRRLHLEEGSSCRVARDSRSRTELCFGIRR